MTDREKLVNALAWFEKRAKDTPMPGAREMFKIAADALREKANGVTVFPCKIGDEFWTEWVGIRKVRCSMLTQKADGSLKGRFTVENSGRASIDVAFNGHHRELFLTKEEAEAYFAKPPKGE